MITFPWYVRFSFDAFLFLCPVYLVYKYPSMLGHPFIDKRRIARRLTHEQSKDILNQNPTFTVQQTTEIFHRLGMEI